MMSLNLEMIEVEVRRRPFGYPFDIMVRGGYPRVTSIFFCEDGHMILSVADGRYYCVNVEGVGFWRVSRPAIECNRPEVDRWRNGWLERGIGTAASLLGREVGIIAQTMKRSAQAIGFILDKTGRLL